MTTPATPAAAFIGLTLLGTRPVCVTAAVPDALSHHAAVVEAARQGPLLPARFGAPAPDPAALLAREQQIMAALARAADAVEIGVGLHPRAVPQPADGGRAYMLWARETAHRARQIAVLADLISALTGVVDHRREMRDDGRIRLALCVRRRHAAAAADAIEAIAAAQSDAARIVVSGPWPIYSFGVDAVLGERVSA